MAVVADESAIQLNFQSDLAQVAPVVITGVENIVKRIVSLADGTNDVVLFGNLAAGVDSAVEAIGGELPKMIEHLRAQLAGGLFPKDAAAQANKMIGTVEDALLGLSKAAGSSVDSEKFAAGLTRGLDQAMKLVGELKAEMKELGATPQAIGALTKTGQRIQDVRSQVIQSQGLDPKTFDAVNASAATVTAQLRDQAAAGAAVTKADKALAAATDAETAAKKAKKAAKPKEKKEEPELRPRATGRAGVEAARAGAQPDGTPLPGANLGAPPPTPAQIRAQANAEQKAADEANAEQDRRDLTAQLNKQVQEGTAIRSADGKSVIRETPQGGRETVAYPKLAVPETPLEGPASQSAVSKAELARAETAAYKEADLLTAAENKLRLAMEELAGRMNVAWMAGKQTEGLADNRVITASRKAEADAAKKTAKDEQTSLGASYLSGDKAGIAEKQRIADEARRSGETALSDQFYADKTTKTPGFQGASLGDTAALNQGSRELGNGYIQYADTLRKQTADGQRALVGSRELYEAQTRLVATLNAEVKSGAKPQGFFAGVLGGSFGHGFDSSAKFDPKAALGNLGGTLGVVGRYSTEYKAFSAITSSIHDVYTQSQLLNSELILYQATLEAVGAKQVNLNASFDAGAKFGLNEADSIALGTAGLKAYSSEVAAGANSTKIFTDSITQAGIAALLTGQQAAVAQAQLVAVTQEFQLGSAGQSRVNDAALSASQHFDVPQAQVLSGLGTAGDIANVSGFTPELLANTLAAVNQDTHKDSSSQVARDLSQGGSATARTAYANLGVNYNSGDVAGTLAKAGAAYAKYDDAQKASFALSLGGARTAETVLALLRQQPAILKATSDAYKDGGNAAQEAAREQATFGGQIKQIGSIAKQLAADLGKSGILDFFGLMLLAIKPVLTALDDTLRLIEAIKPGGVEVSRIAIDIGVALGALRLLAGLGGGAGRLGAAAGTTGTRAILGSAGTNVLAGGRRINPLLGSKAGDAEKAVKPDVAATSDHTKTVISDTTAITDHTVAVADATAQDALQLDADQTNLAAQATLTDGLVTLAAAVDTTSTGVLDLGVSSTAASVETEALVTLIPPLTIAAQAATTSLLDLGVSARTVAVEQESVAPAAAGAGAGLGKIALGAGAVVLAADLAYQAYKKITAIDDTKGAAATAASGPLSGDPTQLRANASAAESAAKAAALASGGIFGSTLNLLSGGNSKQISDARSTAARDNALADALEKVKAAGQAKGDFTVDTSSIAAIGTSLSAMTANGAGTTDVINALNVALDNLGTAGAGAAARLTPTNALEGGLGAGAGAGQGLQNIRAKKTYSAEEQVALINGSDELGLNKADADAQRKKDLALYLKRDADAKDKASVKGLDTKGLSNSENTVTTQFLKDNPSFNPKDPKAVASLKEQIKKTIQTAPGGNKVTASALNSLVNSVYTGVIATLPSSAVDTGSPGVVQALFTAQSTNATTHGQQVATDVTAGNGFRDTALSAADLAKTAKDQAALNKALATQKSEAAIRNRALHDAGSGKLNLPSSATDGLVVATAQAPVTADLAKTAADAKAYTAHPEAQESAAVTGARTALADVTAAYNKAKATKKLDPAVLAQDYAAVETASANLASALTQQMSDAVTIANSQLAVTDKVGQDQNAINAAIANYKNLHGHDLALAKANTKIQIQSQGADIAAANAAALTAGLSVGAAPNASGITPGQAAGDASSATYDPRNVIANAQSKLAGDTGIFNQIAATEKDQKVKDAAYWAAYMTTVDDRIALTNTNLDYANAAATAGADTTSPVQTANAAMQVALNNLQAQIPYTAQWLIDYTAWQGAQAAVAAAALTASQDILTLNSDATDPVAVATTAAQTAAVKLAKDKARGAAPDVINADTIASDAAAQARQKAANDQFLSDAQTNYDLHRTSYTAYLQQLEARDALLKLERSKLKQGTEGYRQLTDEINSTETTLLGLTSQLQGQFNLGDIKIPTIYEVRRQVASTQAGVGYTDARVTSITINGIGSTQEVVQIVKQQLGTSATVTRAPATVKKA